MSDDTTTVTLYGGPLDGTVIDVDPTDPEPGVAMVSDNGRYEGGRSWYEPDDVGVWRWVRDTP